MAVLLSMVGALWLASQAHAVSPYYNYASQEAVGRWHDLKFGLRIHWGEYAVNGQGPESWPLTKKNLSEMKVYWDQYKNWNPKHYDPNEWVALMQRAGIKHFVFTTKHHEGFSMFDTNTRVYDCWKLTDEGAPSVQACNHSYSSMEAFGRDVVGELVAAARKGGITPGLYFSHIDWYDAAMRIDQWNPVGQVCKSSHATCDADLYDRATDPETWARFVLRHRAQIAEVLTKYGEIIELSFDMDFPSKFDNDMVDTIRLARELAPNTLFRGRGLLGMGDYTTPEETFPDTPLPGNWQVIYHGSNFMSYDPVASNYVNGSFIIEHLVDIVAKGGMMQIGYGPDRDGQFHPKAVEALEYAGRWLSVNGEAIYSTRPCPAYNDTASSFVRYTRSTDGSVIYATALGLPALGSIKLNCVSCHQAGCRVTLLGYEDPATRVPIPIVYEAQADGVTLVTPNRADPGAVALMDPGFSFRIHGGRFTCAPKKSVSSTFIV